ncbi:MAG: lysoplasmalogenase family protein [Defluviitaleaceae bacterium]|nr:lysoplasmalogenase family protein [Defluviitaleaceae bacterium]
MIPEYKFAFIACCLIVALFSYARCYSKKEWCLLVCGLGFTLLADYFLVLSGQHLFGVAAFCFVHVFYIFRAVEFKKWMAVPLACVAVVWVIVFAVGSVVAMAGLYALLFFANIIVNIKSKNHRPRANFYLVMVGLALFALCDINVMLFNLARYTGITHGFDSAFMLIWIFYLPSQLLLAISALRLSKSPKLVEQEV